MRKVVYPYEYMDGWEKFIEALLPEKYDFISHLNIEGIADADYAHRKRVCKDFKIRKLMDYFNLYVQIYILLLADYFKTSETCFLKYMVLLIVSAARLA